MRKPIGLVLVIMMAVVLGCEMPFEISQKESATPASAPSEPADPSKDDSATVEDDSDAEKKELEERIAELEKKIEQKPAPPPPPKPKVKKKSLPSGYRTVHSPGDGWLALRSNPNSGSRLIVKIPHGSEVYVSRCGPRVVSGRLKGRWCKVEYGNLSGWSFDYYLRR